LREARDLLSTCAKAACGRALKQECTTQFVRLDSADIPSIVPSATDSAGAPLVDVEVAMDGEHLTSRLDGQPLLVDPGLHEFSFTTSSGLNASQKVMIVQGERGRLLSVSLRSDHGQRPPATATPSPASAVEASGIPDKRSQDNPSAAPVAPEAAPAHAIEGASAPEVPLAEERPTGRHTGLPWVVAGAAVAAGVGTGALIVALGNHDSPFVASNMGVGISLGVGVAAVGVATWLFATSGQSDSSPASNHGRTATHVPAERDRKANDKATHRAAYVFDVAPTASGAFASLSGAF
jgi:hypothetical protein